MTYVYAISAPEVFHDLIIATGTKTANGDIMFRTIENHLYGLFRAENLIRCDQRAGEWPAELVWEGEVPRPYSLNRDSLVKWVKQSIKDHKARVAEAQPKPDPVADGFARIERRLDETMDMYRQTVAQINQATALPGPRRVGKVAELAMGYGEPQNDTLRRARAYRTLRELAGHIEGGSGTTVSIAQDDATGSWFVRTVSQVWSGPSLFEAIDKAQAHLDGLDGY